MIKFFFTLLFITSLTANAQELFVFTEPASNMPAKSLGIRLTNTFMHDGQEHKTNFHFLPELMWGANKNLMIHAESFISNRNKGFVTEGFGLYGKFRFLSYDGVHSHFRMAAFVRASFNKADIHQEEIEINGHNSGYETGIIATGLLNKIALSSSASLEKAMNNGNYKFPSEQSSSAINYTFSFGKLMLPKTYLSYKQTNMNMMIEFIGQSLSSNGKSYLDIAPSFQFIVNSQARIDVAYRKQLYSSMQRTAPNGFLIRFEYLLFSVLK